MGTASAVTIFPQLDVGDSFRIAFSTLGTRDALSTDIADYNAFVSAQAAADPGLNGLGTTWTAIASTISVDAQDNTSTNPNVSAGVRIFNTRGQLIAIDNSALWDGNIDNIIYAADETSLTSLPPGGTKVIWTGSLADGTAGDPLGLGPTANAGFSESLFGSDWITGFDGNISSQSHMLGISDVITIVPEPSAALLGLIGMLGACLRRTRR